eukprot:4517922-Pyramimonas_sp.AAC.1
MKRRAKVVSDGLVDSARANATAVIDAAKAIAGGAAESKKWAGGLDADAEIERTSAPRCRCETCMVPSRARWTWARLA